MNDKARQQASNQPVKVNFYQTLLLWCFGEEKILFSGFPFAKK